MPEKRIIRPRVSPSPPSKKNYSNRGNKNPVPNKSVKSPIPGPKKGS